MLAKHELMRGTWNELFTFIDAYTKSNDINERQVRKNIIHYIRLLVENILNDFYFIHSLVFS